MLNIYKYYDDAKSLPLYNELEHSIQYLDEYFYWGESISKLDLDPVLNAIKKTPKLALYYASNILDSRFPECEPIIMVNPEIAYLYARGILATDPQWKSQPGHEGGRWPEAELIIIKTPQWAYWYAHGVIKGRWVDAESNIIKDSYWAYMYAKDVLQTRWPEAEPRIMKESKHAYQYAINILRKDSEWTSIKGHENGRWPEAEPYIMVRPEYAYKYATQILKDRWKEAEPYIEKIPNYWNPYKNFFEIE